jgi:hypothetical protein
MGHRPELSILLHNLNAVNSFKMYHDYPASNNFLKGPSESHNFLQLFHNFLLIGLANLACFLPLFDL